MSSGLAELFDATEYRVRRRRANRADNAKKNRSGRIVVAGGVIIDDSGRVLLIHRATTKLSQWETPGGKVEYGESPRDAAVREVFEELHIEVRITADLGWHEFEMGSSKLRYALYEMRICGGTPELAETSFDRFGFFRWNEIDALKHSLSPNARAVVGMYFKGRLSLTKK